MGRLGNSRGDRGGEGEDAGNVREDREVGERG